MQKNGWELIGLGDLAAREGEIEGRREGEIKGRREGGRERARERARGSL